MGAAASCSSSPPISFKRYDVFISFRGEDTRTNFTSHLHTALSQKSIRTYIDYELPKGDDISQSLIQAIQDSSVSIVVFSKNYASSKWCLDELTHILQCRKDLGQFVIPVFYKVDPSDVRKQNGTYKEAFAKHERDFIHNRDKVNKWKDALYQTANLAGWDSHSRTLRDESELIQNIIKDVLQKLDSRHPTALRGLVGIDENCQCVELLLEKVQIVGIWGMGGIGKTTIAMAVFSKLSPQYESCYFFENVREESEKNGLKYIRDKLVSELLKEENIYPSKVQGSTFVMRRLSCRKVLIVLDDVDSSKQLDYLAKEFDCLGSRSRVIITTRDKHLLIGRVNEIHEAKALNSQESLKLFSFKAFYKEYPDPGYEQLSKRAIVYAEGIPLALIVLGSFLHSKTKEEWDDALNKLKTTPNEDIQTVLKLSYDGLNFEEKEIFLDIACFLKGEIKERVIRLLDSNGFHATIGVRVLQDKALIITNGDRVWMHDLIQEMGWQIIRQECIKNPGRRSRLWDPKEIYDVFKNNLGTNIVEGIMLNASRIRDVSLSVDTFKKMNNIRFFKLYSWDSASSNVHLPRGFEFSSNKLRYFEWNRYPLQSLPSTFCPENLVELNMKNSLVETLWEGVQDVVNLKRINLSGCKQLRDLPNFSKAQHLEWMSLYCCQSLYYIHPSILSLHTLVFLNLNRCYNLRSLQSESHLRSLRGVLVHNCHNLKEFSMSSEELTHLSFSGTKIEILHPSIGRLRKLRSLELNGSRLKNVPIKELCRLISLEVLKIYDHIFDKPHLHMLFDSICSIGQLWFLECHNLIELPSNIKRLSRLQTLSLCGCKNLQFLPELPLSVKELDVTHCISLSINCSSVKGLSLLSKEIEILDPPLCSSSIGYLTNLTRLRLSGSSLGNLPVSELCCFKSLVELRLHKCEQVLDNPKLHVLFEALRSLKILDFQECRNLNELPNNIRHLSRLEDICLNGCTRLRFILELPRSIKKLEANNCISLETVFTSTISRVLQKNVDKTLSFVNCEKLDEHSLCTIVEDAEFSLKRAVYHNHSSSVCYAGNTVPMWFRHNRTRKASVTIQLPLPCEDLLGFVFCFVLPPFNSDEESQGDVHCQCHFEDGKMIECPIFVSLGVKFNSDNVLLRCHTKFCKNILKRLKGSRGNDEGSTDNQKVLFKFKFCGGFLKKCGVSPIYASEYHSFVKKSKSESKLKLKLKLCTRSKRCRDTDEMELEHSEIGTDVRSCDEKEALPPCKKLKLELRTQSMGHNEDIDELEALLMRLNIS